MEDDVFASFHAETIRKRLVELRLAAGDEGIEWDQDSELGMWTFLRRSGVSSRPFLTLREDGHIRALWENDQGEQIGLQFLDSIMVQYVIFSRMGSGGIGRTYGVGEQSVVRALIDATGVAGLLNA